MHISEKFCISFLMKVEQCMHEDKCCVGRQRSVWRVYNIEVSNDDLEVVNGREPQKISSKRTKSFSTICRLYC